MDARPDDFDEVLLVRRDRPQHRHPRPFFGVGDLGCPDTGKIRRVREYVSVGARESKRD